MTNTAAREKGVSAYSKQCTARVTLILPLLLVNGGSVSYKLHFSALYGIQGERCAATILRGACKLKGPLHLGVLISLIY